MFDGGWGVVVGESKVLGGHWCGDVMGWRLVAQ